MKEKRLRNKEKHAILPNNFITELTNNLRILKFLRDYSFVLELPLISHPSPKTPNPSQLLKNPNPPKFYLYI